MDKFRKLTAGEIECRIAQVKDTGIILLLYKDARCDMNLLDETVTPEGWQKKYELINGNLFCSVGIKDDEGEWIWKQDVGTESYTEKEKGQASDAFKRACFNWGIGRELYTAPFIWINKGDCDIKTGNKCYDRFYVSDIGYKNGAISYLKIKKEKTNALVYSYGGVELKIDENKAKVLNDAFKTAGKSLKAYTEQLGIEKLSDMTISQFDAGMKAVGAK